MFFGKVS